MVEKLNKGCTQIKYYHVSHITDQMKLDAVFTIPKFKKIWKMIVWIKIKFVAMKIWGAWKRTFW